jgi:hypothetical protein
MRLRLYPKGEPEGQPTYEQGLKDGRGGFWARLFGGTWSSPEYRDGRVESYLDGYEAGLKEWRAAGCLGAAPEGAPATIAAP